MDYQIFNEDCLEGMKRLPDNSVDCIITDLPYNLTDCAWDKAAIDLPAMWAQFKRILKPYNSAVMFASGKFTHKLIASNLDWYKYKWIWEKNAPTGFVHAKNMPMHKFEEILIFSDGSINHPSCTTRRMKYNPQGLVPCEIEVGSGGRGAGWVCSNKGEKTPTVLGGGELKGNSKKKSPQSDNVLGGGLKSDRAYHCHGDWEHRDAKSKWTGVVGGARPSHVDYYIQEQTGYPTDILKFNVEPATKKLHPTQKPVDLLEYLIRTYTNEGETVLDATMGSGSTGVAAINTGRKFIGFELEEKFYEIARERIDKAERRQEQDLFKEVDSNDEQRD